MPVVGEEERSFCSLDVESQKARPPIAAHIIAKRELPCYAAFAADMHLHI